MRSVEERRDAILGMVEANYRAGAERDDVEERLSVLIRDGEGLALLHDALVSVFGREEW